ncbi:L-fuculose-phosphate aldolase [Rhodoglobus vestalii]|uniref:L-fuculose-phosphate aldolase n=1 Tax=Rhodoglobus vestalii TaxID=193384 RepID=A0A8H2K5V4_9MICO|nr:class II aldolase/adducin family protein [Rhodoglobus vestalii]TQO20685.1 L-fuculose-phosphate aldolase [Rhodoglobus vestalii]
MTDSDFNAALIDQVIAMGADIVRRKLTLASAGNISFRDPENPTRFFVTAAASWLDALTEEDLSHIDMHGTVLSGSAQPSSEWRVHAEAYLTRTDVDAVVHAHPQYSVLLDALGHRVRLITLDHVSYVKSVGMTPFAPNASTSLASGVASQLHDHDCVIMSHHGCVVVGDTLTMAYRRILNLEEAAENTYRALALGDATTAFPADQVLSVHS